MNIFAIASAALLAASCVEAKSEFLAKIPNGSRFGMWLGHKSNGGYTQFAMDFIAQNDWTVELCKMPFQGATPAMTYGDAFGDPCCTWKAGVTPKTITAWTEGGAPTEKTTCDATPAVTPRPTTRAPTPTTRAPTPAPAPAPTSRTPRPTTSAPTQAPTPTTSKPNTPTKRPGCKRTRRI